MLRARVGPDQPLSPDELNTLLDSASQFNPQGPALNPHILPNRQPLSVRYRDHYRRAMEALGPAASEFSPGPAMDRFRDIPPALVLAVFEGDLVVIEPGSVGPLPMGHPAVAELIDCINRRYLTPTLLSLVLECAEGEGSDNEDECRSSKKLYDGGLVVGILDYRKSTSFATIASPANNGNGCSNHVPSSASSSTKGLLSSMATQEVAPEMHKVFLRPSYAAMAPFFGDADEAECLLALHPTLLTDPDPACWQALEWTLYDRDKVAVYLAGWLKDYPSELDTAAASSAKANKAIHPDVLPPLAKLKQLAALEEYRARRAAGYAEAFLGIDQRRNLARTRSHIPTTVMNHPNQRVWRTVRFEREHEGQGSGKSYYSVNILSLSDGRFDVILRRGSLPDTAQGPRGFSQRFCLPSLHAVEIYLANLKQLFNLEDYQRKLTVDVANPVILQSAQLLASQLRK